MKFGLTEYNERLDKIKKRIKPSLEDEATDEEYLLGVIHELTFSPYFDSGRFFSEATAIERLIMEDVLFVGKGMKAVVWCNDLFWWACADTEKIEYNEIQSLWDAFEKDGHRGAMKWCCLKRGMQPQLPIRKRWKEDGFWNDELEALKDPGPS